MNPSSPLYLRACVIVSLLLAGQAAVAQSSDTPNAPGPRPPAAQTETDGETLVLSPFVVSSAGQTGYQATTTLAGTRLRTELKDVGTSITVVTTEFLQDTGATGTRDLLSYVTGSEVAGPGGNFLGGGSGAGGGAASENTRGSQATTRLRGLAAASETRGFYTTSIPFDAYNVERVEINRGANSILFGSGSPAGIINSSLKQAQMKDRYVVEARYGSYNSSRASIDLNQQIIKGELALRLTGLDKRQKYQQDLAFEDDARLYGALTYDPKWARTENGILSGTVLRANTEHGQIDARRPRTLPPSDRITGWFNPWFGGYPAKFVWDAGNYRSTTVVNGVTLFTASPAVQTTFGIFRNATVWFNNPDSATPNTGSTIGGVEIAGRQGVISNLPAAGTPLGTALFASSPDIPSAAVRTAGLYAASFYFRNSLQDESIFDFRNKLLDGPNRFEYADFETYNVALEQRFFRDRAGFELAFDKQQFTEGVSSLISATRHTEISIDNNSTLLDGTPNPNFGRPFMVGQWNNTHAQNEAKTSRATVFYKFDFAEVVSPGLAKWLGTLTFTGLHEEGEIRARSVSGDRFSTGADFIYGTNKLVTDNNGAPITTLSYIGPSLANASTASGANIPGLTALQLPSAAIGRTFQMRTQVAGGTFVNTPLTITEDALAPTQFVTVGSKTGTDARAQAAVVQGKLLHNALVATFGWRRDTVDSFTVTPTRGPINNLIVDDAVWVLPSTPSSSMTDETKSRSFVFHVPQKFVRRVPFVSSLSLRHNTSGNFSPGGTRYDPNGRVLPAPSGTTRDQGFSVGLADDRIVLTATWYETAQNGVTAAGNIGGLTSQLLERWRVFNNITGLGLNPGAAAVTAPPAEVLALYGFKVTNGSASYNNRTDVVLTQDFVSTGVEFEMNVNLTRNWRLLLNATKQEATRSNTGAVFRELFFERKINGQTLFENWTGPAGQAAKTTESGQTLAFDARAIANSFNTQALQDGGPAQEIRKWRANAVTHYSFDRTSRLKGFGIGGGVRWQDKVAIGFPVITTDTGALVSDVKNPFFGPQEWNVDSWVRYEKKIFRNRVNMVVQLNLYNVLNDDALIPVGAQPDGSVAVYRIPAERRYELSTRFEF